MLGSSDVLSYQVFTGAVFTFIRCRLDWPTLFLICESRSWSSFKHSTVLLIIKQRYPLFNVILDLNPSRLELYEYLLISRIQCYVFFAWLRHFFVSWFLWHVLRLLTHCLLILIQRLSVTWSRVWLGHIRNKCTFSLVLVAVWSSLVRRVMCWFWKSRPGWGRAFSFGDTLTAARGSGFLDLHLLFEARLSVWEFFERGLKSLGKWSSLIVTKGVAVGL